MIRNHNGLALYSFNFPWLKAKEIEINNINVLALRVNYMGELGWELHVSMNKMEKLYELLMDAGRDLKIINFGSHAMNSMRMEKGYRGWGAELTPEIRNAMKEFVPQTSTHQLDDAFEAIKLLKQLNQLYANIEEHCK